jgi:hypothetical protein
MKEFATLKEMREYMRERNLLILVWIHTTTGFVLRTTRDGNMFSPSKPLGNKKPSPSKGGSHEAAAI